VVIRSSSPYSGEIQWAERTAALAPGTSAARYPGSWPTPDGNGAIDTGFWADVVHHQQALAAMRDYADARHLRDQEC
jgi:hypothetical protein